MSGRWARLLCGVLLGWAGACQGGQREQVVVEGPSLPALRSSLEKPPQHVVLIVIDTLRDDVVEKVQTPVFDRLAQQGSKAAVAWSAGTWTAPSMASLFSGQSVRQHGWDFPFPGRMNDRTTSYPPIGWDPVIAEVLHKEGFKTSAYYANPLLGHGLGFARGFSRWNQVRDRKIAGEIERYVSQWSADERHFVYIHLFGAHSPLKPTQRSRERWDLPSDLGNRKSALGLRRARKGSEEDIARYRRAYHAVVEDVDHRLGKLLQAFGPVLEHTLLIITSDHGELLGEHDQIGHKEWVWEPLTRVPLVVVGSEPLPPQVSTAAIPDLITRSLGLEHAWPITLDTTLSLVSQREGKLAISPDGDLKGIWPTTGESRPSGIYRLSQDPGETKPLSVVNGTSPELETLQAARRQFEASTPQQTLQARDAVMSDDMRDALEMLGYLE